MLRVFRRLALLLPLAFLPLVAAVPAHAESLKCQREPVPVNLSATSRTTYQLVGWACWKGTAVGKPVQILVPGFTYDHTYWDFGKAGYSYVEAATDAGTITFALDRLGTGQSAHPPSAVLTASAHVFALHQLIAFLRAQFPGSDVLTVGHSAGSGTVLQEAADNADVDGVIITGLMHEPQPVGAQLFASFYPAALDPSFGTSGLDPGYLTTQPGTRGPDFYNLVSADPLVIAQDEATKSTGSSTELSTGDTAFLASTSQSIHVPVLLAMGQYDNSFCNPTIGLSCDDPAALLARESADYAPEACLEAFVLPMSGHDINLHPNAGTWYAAANDWISRHPDGRC
jgi:alpha-beta hydrolase superfamily lysophospholipase